MHQGGQVDAGEVSRTARDVLSGAEFRPPPRSLFERILEAVSDLVGDLLSRLAGSGGATALGWAVIALGVAAVAWAIFRAAVSGAGRRRRQPAPQVADVDWWAEAQRHRDAGRWRDAARAAHTAITVALSSRGVLDATLARTPRQVARLAAGAPPTVVEPSVGQRLGAVTDRYERFAYGHDDDAGPTVVDDLVAIGADLADGRRGRAT